MMESKKSSVTINGVLTNPATVVGGYKLSLEFTNHVAIKYKEDYI